MRTVRSLITILCVLLGFGVDASRIGQDSIVVSLITCDPGREVYELCGHEAIRIHGVVDGVRMDSVWNYGVFDFNQPNFIYRFVKGQTDYMLAGYPFSMFMPEYVMSGRGVTEQQLNLTQKEAWKLLDLLRKEALPENCQYRYNYVKDNCSTRVVDRVDQATGRRVIYPDDVRFGTFRDAMRHYHRNYPWYQFGIDLALGSGIDLPINGRAEMFVPVELKEKAARAKFEDGTPFVRATVILSPDSGEAVDPSTPWYLTPFAVAIAALLLVSILCVVQLKKRLIFPLLFSLWFGITGIAGCVVCFLVFFSEHEATSPNLLLIWLNPLQLIFAISVWFRSARVSGALNMALAWYNIIGVGSLLLVWAFQNQDANIAFFPMMGISVMLSAVYAEVASQKFIKNEKISIFGTGKYGGNQRRNPGSGQRSGGAKAGRRNSR